MQTPMYTIQTFSLFMAVRSSTVPQHGLNALVLSLY